MKFQDWILYFLVILSIFSIVWACEGVSASTTFAENTDDFFIYSNVEELVKNEGGGISSSNIIIKHFRIINFLPLIALLILLIFIFAKKKKKEKEKLNRITNFPKRFLNNNTE